MRASSSRGWNGLAEIVVGPHLEAEDAIDLLAARREHEHGQPALRAQVAADLEAVGAGHHEVEDHQVDGALRYGAQQLAAVGQGRNPEAVALEVLGE